MVPVKGNTHIFVHGASLLEFGAATTGPRVVVVVVYGGRHDVDG